MEVALLSGELALVRCNEKTPPTLDGFISLQLFYLKSYGSVLRLIFQEFFVNNLVNFIN